MATLLEESQKRNFQKWDILDRKIWPNYYVGESYENEIGFLQNWTIERLKWLDDTLQCFEASTQFNTLESEIYPNPFINHVSYKFSLKKLSPVSIQLYNLNGALVDQVISNKYYSSGEHSVSLDFSKIPSSVYFIVFKMDGEIISREKLIKL